ncbi:acyl-CoA dehydrogenase family protein [Nocardia sp. NBC_01730]|uniref:acyl-CoA dehydrogenase family protein n=1 Tax=Nocardia sp. NBC_01730 TaxID=2975998 RepID=UPI002E0D5F90|nr:acyl-CoA dehydrogenase family protein [Nocardia sp. NBC_01730]
MPDNVVPNGTSVENFCAAVEAVLDDRFHETVAEAERQGVFPREVLARLGAAGIFTDKWAGGYRFQLAKLVGLHTALGAACSGGVGVGVTLHDSALAMLYRFASSDHLRSLCADATAGTAVLCIGASEEAGGSDLQAIRTTAVRDGSGYVLTGAKAFVSLSSVADFVLVLARCVENGVDHRLGNLGLFALPLTSASVGKPYDKLGVNSLDTAPIEFDTWLPDEALLGRPGIGLAAITWGLTHERLSVAAQVSGACGRVLGLTVARMMRREQFGKPLFGHQALRLRVAELHARVDMLRLALQGMAATEQIDARTAAGLKVTAARLGQEVVDECLHIFGGLGYLTEETPLARWWQDMRLSRIGSGTDEVLWELVAAGMKPDFNAYDALFGRAQPTKE